MKRKWWLIIAGFLITALIIFAVFWQSFVIYIMPKTVLAAALSDTISSLEDRFQASPMAVLARGLDSHGNTVMLQLDTSNERLGDIRYEMDMQIEHNPRRIYGQGQAISKTKTLDLEIYMDGTFSAFSSKGLLQGRFYGIDYHSFARDLENNRILMLLLGSNTVSEWKGKILQLQNIMNTTVSVPEVPDLDFKKLIPALMVLDVEVEKENILIEGEPVACHEISFESTGAQILEGIGYLGTELPLAIDPNAQVDFSFFLQDDVLRKVELSIDSADSETEIQLLIGTYDTFCLIRDSFGFREIAVHTEYDDLLYRETISLNQSRSNVATNMQVEYSWNRSSGDGEVSVSKDNQVDQLTLNLQKGERGFLLKCDDFEGLMHIVSGMPDSGNSQCTMEVLKDAQVNTPEYKSLHQWSMDDMLILLSGVGDLLGLKPIG